MIRINKDELYACAYEISLAVGESPEGAKIVADNLILADLRGINTHGTYLLTPIVNRVSTSCLSLPTKTTIVTDEGAVAVIDGGDGLGPVAGKYAVDLSIERAARYGISIVLIRRTNNLGALAYYTEMVAREGMISIMSCNAAPAMAPWGGARAFLGTNPIAIAAYTGKDLLFSADMATSIVARGKIRKAARENKSIPNDWALDEEGNLTTDPVSALNGVLLPMGGPKGSALALTVDIISGILAGAEHAPNIKSFHGTEGKTGVGASLISIDIRKFMKLEEFTSSISEYFSEIKALKKANFATEIYIPGEIEYQNELNNLKNGILIEEEAFKAICGLADKLGLDQSLKAMA